MKHRSSWSSACALLTAAFVSAGTLTPAFGEERVAYDYTPLNQTQMKAVTTDSVATNEGSNGPINLVLDNNKDTYWHTAYGNGRVDPLPHSFVIDLGQDVLNLGQVTLTPRQSSNGSGRVGKYSIETSVDPRCSAEATVASAEFQEATSGQQEAGQAYDPANLVNLVVNFDPRPARCVRVIYNSSWGGNSQPENVATLAEFNAATAVKSSEQPAPEPPTPTPEDKPEKPGIVTVDSYDTQTWRNPSDTPAWPFLDKDGQFRYLHAAALYGEKQARHWQFFTGPNMDRMNADSELNSAGTNADTTLLCNTSPTGRESSFAPSRNHYSQRNFCDLINVWVDPDTGDWYGLIHNEFTPQPFADGLHFDSIDYAVSHDQGKHWAIPGHAITSPYSTVRGDNQAFPEQTYYYGDGDPRLYVDYSSGYFYVFYGSRVVNKRGSWVAFHEHVARAPISGKMKTGTWQKWYNGTWQEPGVGGKESNMVPVSDGNPDGYTPVEKEYNPNNRGTAQQQVATGLMPDTSPLFVMDVTYNAYLGLYIAQPQHKDQSGRASQEYYATDNLATQKWVKIGDTGKAYYSASWYRWFLDSANKTNSSIVGKNFRAYCSFGCKDNRVADLINLSVEVEKPYKPIDTSKVYTIANGSGQMLKVSSDNASLTTGSKAEENNGTWVFKDLDDGSYMILSASGKAIGVDSSSNDGRAWDAPIKLSTADPKDVGQQWFAIPLVDQISGEKTATLRLVNRYSGLTLAMGDSSVATAPQRSWDQDTGGVTRYMKVNDQALTLSEFIKEEPEPAPQPEPEPAPQLTLDNVNVKQGEKLTLRIEGLKADEIVNIAVHSDLMQLGTLKAEKDGTATFTWSVPKNFKPGTHHFEVKRAEDVESLSIAFIVRDRGTLIPTVPQPIAQRQEEKTADGRNGLAHTGISIAGLLAVSVGLTGAGIAIGRKKESYA
ncbi:discoidin domain-containing protein [Arcanobacterium phocae]|uniref:discoidin domain-containing protein n=1 Tax=Arcanobacterium phocae TaxID=131112 RepID=UPI001C0F30E9|nr:discoidin domain-containing protein [Arcanobacterium phocae]